jgi:hypothetical protein
MNAAYSRSRGSRQCMHLSQRRGARSPDRLTQHSVAKPPTTGRSSNSAGLRSSAKTLSSRRSIFLRQTVEQFIDAAALVWLAGLVGFMLWRRLAGLRLFAIAFVALVGAMVVLHDKPYYFANALPVLFAGGAVAPEEQKVARAVIWCECPLSTRGGRLFALPRRSAVGHEERFPARRLSGRCEFRKRSMAVGD